MELFRCVLISKVQMHLVAIMFVDDTEILHINMHKDEYVVEAHKTMQTIISNLGQLKFATGGVFKPVK